MARIRTIKPEFYGDERILALPEGARFTAVGLISYADDRGRGKLLLSSIRGVIYPAGDVTERTLAKRLDAICDVGFALRYEHGGLSYLWLPGFWKHQVINKPTESILPPHPEDAYAHLPVADGLAKFREDYRSGAVVLPPSRVGARFPAPCSLPVVDVSNSNDNGGSEPARDDALPSGFPAELEPHLAAVLDVLSDVAVRHRSKAVRRGALASVLVANRRKSLVREAHKWRSHWDDSGRPVRNPIASYRNWLDRADDLAAIEPVNGHAAAKGSAPPRSPVLEHADRWQRFYPSEGAA